MIRYRPLFLVTILLFLTFWSTAVLAESYADLRADYQELVLSKKLQGQRVNWEKLLRRFDRFIASGPRTTELEKALFLQARPWDGLSLVSGSSNDARAAVDRYLSMADAHPGSNLADDALFNAGQVCEDRLDADGEAYRYYDRLVTTMPNGDMVPDARRRIESLPAVVKATPVVTQAPAVDPEPHQEIGDAPRLERIRFWSGPEYTRVVLDLTAPVVAQPHFLKGDNPRLYFDLLYTRPAAELEDLVPVRNGLIKQVRSSMFDEQRLRVVLDLNRVAEYKLAVLESPNRLVIDVAGSPEPVGLTAAPPTETSSASISGDDSIANILDASAERQPVLHVPQDAEDTGIHLIVVDAGHGGHDPGAIGVKKTREKDVTLELAKEVANSLRRKMGVKVMLTRSDDRFLELRERTAYANQVGADLFISLHANASKNHDVYGLETYFLNLSKNNQAAEVAARENGTSLQDVGNLEAILFDLMANAKINESSRLAAVVQQSMVAGLRSHYSKIKDLGVKQGPFHVLLGAAMPSVLVEAAFISHPREEDRLLSSDYRKRVADAITQGVMNYAESVNQVVNR